MAETIIIVMFLVLVRISLVYEKGDLAFLVFVQKPIYFCIVYVSSKAKFSPPFLFCQFEVAEFAMGKFGVITKLWLKAFGC